MIRAAALPARELTDRRRPDATVAPPRRHPARPAGANPSLHANLTQAKPPRDPRRLDLGALTASLPWDTVPAAPLSPFHKGRQPRRSGLLRTVEPLAGSERRRKAALLSTAKPASSHVAFPPDHDIARAPGWRSRCARLTGGARCFSRAASSVSETGSVMPGLASVELTWISRVKR